MANAMTNACIKEHENEEVLNEALLDQYQKLKKGLLPRLISTYLEEAPNYFAKIRAGVEVDNFEEIYAGCHAMKSCSGNLGATQLSQICQDMESAAREKDKDKIVSLFAELGPSSFEVEEALKAKRLSVLKADELNVVI